MTPITAANMDYDALGDGYRRTRVDPDETAELVERLRRDLETRECDRRFGHLRSLPEFDAGYRLVVAETWRHRGRATEATAGANRGASTTNGSRAPKVAQSGNEGAASGSPR